MTPTDPSATTLRPAPLHIGVLLGVLGVVYGDIGTSPLYAFKATLDRLTGAYALAVLIEGEDELILGARRGSPLVVGWGEGEYRVGGA